MYRMELKDLRGVNAFPINLVVPNVPYGVESNI